MLKEALDFLSQQFGKAREARLLNIPGDGRTAYVDQGGTLTKIDIEPKPRESKVDSVDDLCSAVKAYGKKEASSIWLSPSAVVAVIDDSDRRDRITLPLRESTQWAAIKRLAKEPTLDQAALVRLLRTELIGIGGRAELLSAVRSIKFRSSAEGTSNIQHGNESMGRVIENAVTGAGVIPEQAICILPLYDNQGRCGDEFQVVLDLEIVASDSKFRLKPLPDSIEDAQNAALEAIREEICVELGAAARVFYGAP